MGDLRINNSLLTVVVRSRAKAAEYGARLGAAIAHFADTLIQIAQDQFGRGQDEAAPPTSVGSKGNGKQVAHL